VLVPPVRWGLPPSNLRTPATRALRSLLRGPPTGSSCRPGRQDPSRSRCSGSLVSVSRRGQHHASAAQDEGSILDPPELRWRAAVSWKKFLRRGYDTHHVLCLRASRRLWPSGRDIPVCLLIGRRPNPSCPGGQHQALVERPCSIPSRGGDHGRRRTDKAPRESPGGPCAPKRVQVGQHNKIPTTILLNLQVPALNYW
jgi:hypothetical protein